MCWRGISFPCMSLVNKLELLPSTPKDDRQGWNLALFSVVVTYTFRLDSTNLMLMVAFWVLQNSAPNFNPNLFQQRLAQTQKLFLMLYDQCTVRPESTPFPFCCDHRKATNVNNPEGLFWGRYLLNTIPTLHSLRPWPLQPMTPTSSCQARFLSRSDKKHPSNTQSPIFLANESKLHFPMEGH